MPMRRLIAFVKSRPKTSIIALLALVFIGAAIWLAVRQSQPQYRVTSSSVMPIMASGESAGAPGMAYYDKAAVPNDAYVGIVPPTPYPPTAGQTAAEVDQKIIKNGYLDLTVDKVSDAADRITAIATARGGFVQSSSVSERGDGTYSGNVEVRVPSEKYEDAMSEIKKLATLVKSETSTGQDVTEQYTDLQAQLRNAQAQEQTYLEILKQAKTVSDTLQVQAQLGSIRGQIESLQGRIQYLTNQTSYSTISVTLEEEPAVRAPTKGFRPLSTIKEATQALIDAFQNILSGLIWIVIVWGGILLPVALLIWIVVKLWKRRAKAQVMRK